MTKQMMFATIILISAHNFIFSILVESLPEKDFVFDKGMNTRINGNNVFAYIYNDRAQDNLSSVFKYTRIVECTKRKTVKEIDTLEELEDRHRNGNINDMIDLALEIQKFRKSSRKNNVIYCHDIEQKLNDFDKLEDVGAIVYGTQDISDCALVREFLRQQKLVAENNKSEAEIAKK